MTNDAFTDMSHGMSPEERKQIWNFVVRQMSGLYGLTDDERSYLGKHFDEALRRTLKCFSHIKAKYYQPGKLNVLHSVQYMIFLYYLANTIFLNDVQDANSCAAAARTVCDKLYGLNKMLSSCDLYYECMLPSYFLAEHPVGSVIGRARIGDGFLFYQGCTVGGNRNVYPEIGHHVIMYSNSKILGNCHIGNNVLIGANAYLKDMDVPDGVIVFGQYPNNIIKDNRPDLVQEQIQRLFV